ncbi:MAG: glycosyltransferase [Bacteroidetes bacterium]|nr:glycosyltransferase [Bacteroidota bacterium]
MNTSTIPLVSIILPVYNCEKYLASSVESILNQSFSDFELIIINDGSKDNTLSVIKAFNDSRIVLIDQQNQGLAKALNNGIRLSRGKYIARQDADDLSYKERLLKQVNYLHSNPSVYLVGTWARIIDENGNDTGRAHHHPKENCTLKFDLCFDNPFVHSSIMMRREIIDTVGVYDYAVHHLVQDFEYWFRISQKFEIANIPEILLDYREVNSGISKTTLAQESSAAVVAKQSAQHISFYLSESHKKYGIILAQLHHGTLSEPIDKTTYLNLLECLDSIDNYLNVNNKCNPALFNLKRHKYLVKYKHYNSFIYSTKTSLPTKLFFKIKRRVLITTSSF